MTRDIDKICLTDVQILKFVLDCDVLHSFFEEATKKSPRHDLQTKKVQVYTFCLQ